jgi:hypothetical protein|nr:MAG TPA: hypothetical protein [Bacteriophage sp.]
MNGVIESIVNGIFFIVLVILAAIYLNVIVELLKEDRELLLSRRVKVFFVLSSIFSLISIVVILSIFMI